MTPAAFVPQDPSYLAQEKGCAHGGILGMIADSACGYAAYSLMPADCSLVTVECKINILTQAEVFSAEGKHVATMQQTLMMLEGTPDQ